MKNLLFNIIRLTRSLILFFLILFGMNNRYTYNQQALKMIHYGDAIANSNLMQKLTHVKVAIIDEGIVRQPVIHFVRLYETKSNERPSHGTVLADLLGARYDLDTGYRGLIPGMPLYGYSLSSNEMNTSSLTQAIKIVTGWNIDIISISMGTNEENSDLRNAVQNAVSSGIVVVCSAGNSPYSPNYPASFPVPGVISVGAIGNDYNILPYTNAGSRVDIYAPGESIASLTDNRSKDNRSKIVTYSGTSVAVPFVTLACIYIRAFAPSWSPAEVESFLNNHSDIYLGNWRNNTREIRVLDMGQLTRALNTVIITSGDTFNDRK